MALTYNDINASCREFYLANKPTDNIFETNPFFAAILKAGNVQTQGGEKPMIPIEYAKSTANGWYPELGTFDNSKQELFTKALEEWFQYYESIVITGKEMVQNSDNAIFNLLQGRVTNARKNQEEQMETMMFNDGTDANTPRGLRYICSASNSPGGISQSSYSWWQAKTDTSSHTVTEVTTTDAADTESALYLMYNMYLSCEGGSSGGPTPNLFYSTPKVALTIQTGLANNQRYTTEKGNLGFSAIQFAPANASVFYSHKTPANHLFYVNPDHLFLVKSSKEYEKWVDFQRPMNQNMQAAKILTTMALLCDSPKRQGIFTNFAVGT